MTPADWTLFVAGGGSGGHLLPALSVLEELAALSRTPRQVCFLTSGRAIDRRILPVDAQIEPCGAVDGAALLRRPLRSLWTLRQSIENVRRLLRAAGPAVMLGTGGFASGPGLAAAVREHTPFVLLESNAVPGRATSWFRRRAAKVCWGFDSPRGRPGRDVVSGVPVRRGIAQLSQRPWGPDRRELLILGGSQGSRVINAAVLQLLESGSASRAVALLRASWTVRHQTGDSDCERVRNAWQRAGISARTAPFFDDMADCFRAASLALTRAGGVTLAELACARLPSLLVPFPRSVRNHQALNARWFARRQAAVVLEETRDLAGLGRQLESELTALLEDAERREQLSRAIGELARPDASTAVAAALCEAVGRPL